ncbi:hypothetical protein HaLaN_22999, partial [Haematococcus lacustris]
GTLGQHIGHLGHLNTLGLEVPGLEVPGLLNADVIIISDLPRLLDEAYLMRLPSRPGQPAMKRPVRQCVTQ